jgi:putative ABC transport system permease protein
MARRYWPGESPIGRTIKAGPGPRLAVMTIVGVVGNVRSALLDAPTPQLYVSSLQQSEPSIVLLVRKAPGASMSAEAIKQAVWSVVPDQPLFDIRSLNDVLARQFAEPRAVGRLLSAFAALSLVMSAMGIYMIVTYLTSRRWKEVAVRRAVGAQASDVISVLAGQTLGWSLAGLVVGIVTAVATTRALQAPPFRLTSIDSDVIATVSALYLAVVLAATAMPIFRVMQLDPSAVLRSE